MEPIKDGESVPIPHELDFEKAALGCMLSYNDGATETVFDMLDRSAFYFTEHQLIFSAGAALFKRNEPVDSLTVAAELDKKNELEKIGGRDYLDELSDRLPSTANVEQYCLILRDSATARKLIYFAEDLKNEAGNKSAPPDLEAIRTRLDQIAGEAAPAAAVRPVADRLREKRDREKDREPGELLGYPLTRFAEIAQQIDGIQPGFYIFAGITHVGKTAFLTNIFYDLLDTNPGLHGIYFSLDDNENVIFNRLLAIACEGQLKINELQKRVNGPNAERLAAAYDRLINWAESGRFNIMDFSQIATIRTVETVLKSNLRDGRDLFAVIDGLQNLDTEKEHGGIREKNVDLAAGIKRLVDVYKIPVFSSVEIRKRKEPEIMPGIDDIMESGKWGYNASHIWIGHPSETEGEFQNFLDRKRPDFELTVSVPKSKISDSPGRVRINVRRAYNQMTVINEAVRAVDDHIKHYSRPAK